MGTVEENREATDKETILAALTVDGQAADAIADATGLPAGTVRARLESLFKHNLVCRDGEGKRGIAFLWSQINSAGIDFLGVRNNSNGHDQWEWNRNHPTSAGSLEYLRRRAGAAVTA